MQSTQDKPSHASLRDVAAQLRHYSKRRDCPERTRTHMHELATRLDDYSDSTQIDSHDPRLRETLDAASIHIDSARFIAGQEGELQRDLRQISRSVALESFRRNVQSRAKYFPIFVAVVILTIVAKVIGWI